VRSAAGLDVDVGDAHEPHASSAARRSDGKRTHQVVARVQRRVVDPFEFHRVRGFDQCIHAGRDCLLVRGAPRHVEIEARRIAANRSPCHRIGQHRREKVTGRVHAHVRVTALPVERKAHRLAGGRGCRACRQHMHDLAARLAFHRVDNGNQRSVFATQCAGVTRLAAAMRIEDRAVEHDAARIGCDHACIERGLIGKIAEQPDGHRERFVSQVDSGPL
jgi:hypothetical protein